MAHDLPRPLRWNLWQRPWFLHLCGWLFIWGLEALPVASEPIRMLRRGGLLLLAAPAIYAHFWALDRLLLKRRPGWYALAFLVILLALGLINQRAHLWFTGVLEPLPGILCVSVGFLVLTAGLRYGAMGVRSLLVLRELREKQVQDELALLKHQINPHFLFNTLNNLYALAHKHDDPRLSEGLSSLARLMRYLIDDARVSRVPLEKELAQLRAYVELQKLRFAPGDDAVISFELHGEPGDVQVAPMLLIPFVENAFKHAPSLHKAVRIHLRMDIAPRELTFTAENTINTARKQTDASPGIGLANVRRRLELEYAGRHELDIRETADLFRVRLTLRLGDGA